jgi:hypothetical protein
MLADTNPPVHDSAVLRRHPLAKRVLAKVAMTSSTSRLEAELSVADFLFVITKL